MRPSIHNELWAKFGGELPENAALRFLLQRDLKFTESGTEDFITQFRGTIAFAGLGPESAQPDSAQPDSGPDKIEPDEGRAVATPPPHAEPNPDIGRRTGPRDPRSPDPDFRERVAQAQGRISTHGGRVESDAQSS